MALESNSMVPYQFLIDNNKILHSFIMSGVILVEPGWGEARFVVYVRLHARLPVRST